MSTFLDSSIFIASFNQIDAHRSSRARDIIRQALSLGQGVISDQVINDFLQQALHHFEAPMGARQAEDYRRVVLSPLCQIHPNQDMWQEALAMVARWGIHWSIACTLAAAQTGGCQQVYISPLPHIPARQGRLELVDPLT